MNHLEKLEVQRVEAEAALQHILDKIRLATGEEPAPMALPEPELEAGGAPGKVTSDGEEDRYAPIPHPPEEVVFAPNYPAGLEPGVFHHVLQRTSPFGEPFLGECIRCGATDLRARDANRECDNLRNLSDADALLEVLDEPEETAP